MVKQAKHKTISTKTTIVSYPVLSLVAFEFEKSQWFPRQLGFAISTADYGVCHPLM